jgi:hypothetical protein
MTVSHLDAVNQDIDVLFVVEADEALNSGAFMRRIWVVPNQVFVFLGFDGQVEVPSFLSSAGILRGG